MKNILTFSFQDVKLNSQLCSLCFEFSTKNLVFDQTILQIWHIYASKYRRNPFRITVSSERDTTSQPTYAWKVSGSLGIIKKTLFLPWNSNPDLYCFRRVLAFIICYKMCKGRTFTSLHKEWLIYSYQSYKN